VALSQDEVVAAAVRLLDEVGLEGLTLRRLAGTLGVSAPTLYWHVRDKRALLDLMADALIAQQRPPLQPEPGQPWYEWLREVAEAQYRALIGHRDAGLVVAGNRPPPDSLPHVERLVTSVTEVGFPPDEALEVLFVLSHFVIGNVVEHQAEAARGEDPRSSATVARLLGSDEFPTLKAAGLKRAGPPDPAASFRFGLDVLIAGLRARLAAGR
jgi:TetR/AcrR family tetracycline transcriptional repressor